MKNTTRQRMRKKALNDMVFKPGDHAGGFCLGINEDKSIKIAIWGTPKQLACLYLDLQDRLPEGVIEYANMIRKKSTYNAESESLETQTPTHNRIYN